MEVRHQMAQVSVTLSKESARVNEADKYEQAMGETKETFVITGKHLRLSLFNIIFPNITRNIYTWTKRQTQFPFVGVKDARDDSIVSIETAAQLGILNQPEGVYNNLKTGEVYNIAVAMNAGFIIGGHWNAIYSLTKASQNNGVVTSFQWNVRQRNRWHRKWSGV